MRIKTDNLPKFVLFEPKLVGWDKGLKIAMADAVSFRVPLAVKKEQDLDRLLKLYPDGYTFLLLKEE